MMLGDATWRSYRAAIVPPGLRHALDVAGGVHGKLFVETDSPSASAFRCRFPYRRGAVTDLNDPEILEIFRWIFEDDPQQTAVERRLDLLLARGPEETHLDPRIQKIVELIRKEPDRNYSQGELAASLGLSPSRMLQLFSEQLGVPYRRFRMWKRLMLSFELLHDQDNMTLAALDSGFADATHYSHAFRDTFGVNPAPVFRKIERFDRLV
jgi:AraC-like DNA-binding protein